MRRMSLLLACFMAVPAFAADGDTRLLRFPDVSQREIVFSYAGDLWIVPKAGGDARRLTSFPGQELYPKFSPDGSTRR